MANLDDFLPKPSSTDSVFHTTSNLLNITYSYLCQLSAINLSSIFKSTFNQSRIQTSLLSLQLSEHFLDLIISFLVFLTDGFCTNCTFAC